MQNHCFCFAGIHNQYPQLTMVTLISMNLSYQFVITVYQFQHFSETTKKRDKAYWSQRQYHNYLRKEI